MRENTVGVDVLGVTAHFWMHTPPSTVPRFWRGAFQKIDVRPST